MRAWMGRVHWPSTMSRCGSRPSRSQAGLVRTGHGLCTSLRRRGPGARELTTTTGSGHTAGRSARRGR
jgi:hypothetical protein